MDSILGYTKERLEELGGVLTAQEIAQQPDLWQETFAQMVAAREHVVPLLSKAKRIIFTGAGSSSFVGATVAPYLTRLLGRPVEAIPTTDLVLTPLNYLLHNEPTLLISCARSGNSPESVAAVQLAKQLLPELSQIVLTCNPEGELAKIARLNRDSLLVLMPERANDSGFAMTGSFTAMALAALVLFAAEGDVQALGETIKKLAACGQQLLAHNVHSMKTVAEGDFDRCVFLGSSCLRAVAEESSLKMLELSSGAVSTVANSALGFRHGPKSIVNDKTIAVFFLSSDAYARTYELDLLKEMSLERRAKGLICMSETTNAEAENLADVFIAMQDVADNAMDDVLLVFPYLLLAQTLAFYKSVTLGVAPDNPSPDGMVNRVVKGVTIYPYNQ